MAFALEPVRRVRLMSLVGDFATCTERSEGPVARRGNMFEMRRPSAPLGAHGLSFLVVIPSHCSGLTFEAALEQAFPRGFIMDSVGSDYAFER
jgi:hypothetical protein